MAHFAPFNIGGRCVRLWRVQENNDRRLIAHRTWTVVDRYCRKRVHGVGAASASEERNPLERPGLQKRFSSCVRPELDSVRPLYHQYQERLFQQYRPEPDSPKSPRRPTALPASAVPGRCRSPCEHAENPSQERRGMREPPPASANPVSIRFLWHLLHATAHSRAGDWTLQRPMAATVATWIDTSAATA